VFPFQEAKSSSLRRRSTSEPKPPICGLRLSLKKAKTADFQVRAREREAHIEVLEARAEKLRLQSREFGGPSPQEAKLQKQIDRLRSDERKIVDHYGLDDEDDGDDELESLSARKPLSRLVKRRKR
jgi:hypothetical protein